MIGVCFKLLSIAPSLLEPGLFTKVRFDKILSVGTLQSLTGNYRFFKGKFAYREILITCFGSVQGLKGQISMKYREIYAFCTGISILYLHSCLCFYNRDFPVL